MVHAASFSKRFRSLVQQCKAGAEVTEDQLGLLVRGSSIELTPGSVGVIRSAVDLWHTPPEKDLREATRGAMYLVNLASEVYRAALSATTAERERERLSQFFQSVRPSDSFDDDLYVIDDSQARVLAGIETSS